MLLKVPGPSVWVSWKDLVAKANRQTQHTNKQVITTKPEEKKKEGRKKRNLFLSCLVACPGKGDAEGKKSPLPGRSLWHIKVGSELYL